VLIIHLKRFKNRVVKNGCCVAITPLLDVSNYCPGDDVQHAHFELYAVANHEGSLQYGHYYADCKKSNGKWYRFNDARVTECGVGELSGEAAYVLFYRRVGGVVANAAKT
jgi:ubiquitin C-terminal hydrolase